MSVYSNYLCKLKAKNSEIRAEEAKYVSEVGLHFIEYG